MELQKHKSLLRTIKQILKHQKEKEVLKGESFNVFSILKMETSENVTHSAFIAALLNPNGTHLKGNVFLELFLSTINNTTIDLASVKVKTEHSVGKVDLINKTGGRIDIYIWDSNRNTISIENKIYAGDQECQVERYCNYNKEKNNVYYLTLEGNDPSEYSNGELVSGVDFYSISYATEIVDWLTLCLKEATDAPILRESIKQYIILLKKLTNTMDKQEEEEIKDLVLKNIKEASLIAVKYNQVITAIKENFRKKVVQLLQAEINEYTIKEHKDINSAYASLWFNNPSSDSRKIWFAVESFSGNGHLKGALFVGIFDKHNSLSLKNQEYNGLNKAWIHHQILTYSNVEVNLSDNNFIQSLANNEEHIVKEVCSQIVGFVNENSHLLNN